jgi:hypothetical protein
LLIGTCTDRALTIGWNGTNGFREGFAVKCEDGNMEILAEGACE